MEHEFYITHIQLDYRVDADQSNHQLKNDIKSNNEDYLFTVTVRGLGQVHKLSDDQVLKHFIENLKLIKR